MKPMLLFGVAGSIASIRAPDCVKLIQAELGPMRIQCVLTQAGAKFTTRTALETFSGFPVLSDDPFSADHLGTHHIAIAREASACLVFGATADFIAKLRAGICDSFLLLQLLSTRAPILLAPAMNPDMWAHPSVQENVTVLKQRGVQIIEPISGVVACGESGIGHIAEMHSIIEALRSALKSKAPLPAPSVVEPSAGSYSKVSEKKLDGKKILISAGPMQTALDPVRFLQNRSSGKMGLALARSAQELGAEVHVLLGPVDQSIAKEFKNFTVTHYASATEYEKELKRLFPACDWFLSAAAVLDFEIEAAPKKLEREDLTGGTLQVRYRAVPDFAAWAGKEKKAHQKVVTFAAETGDDQEIIRRATEKMFKKNADAMIANPVCQGLGPSSDYNLVWFLKPGASPKAFGPQPKTEVAFWIWEQLLNL
jgi:phosphopantothenoylcysteine decarboxylase/phosphopantothenate--cysteine ligase